MSGRITWRKQPSETGLARVCQMPRGYEAHYLGGRIASVSPKTKGFSREVLGWYFYARFGGKSINTCDAPPFPTKEAARDAAKDWLKQARGDQPADAVDVAAGGRA